MKKIFSFAQIMLILILFSGCEDYEDKYNYAVDENRQLESKIDELESDIANMQTEIDEKTEQIEELENENEELKNILEEAGIEY